MNNDITRRMPFSLEAEQSVLGSILIDPESFTAIADIITSDDFFLEEHRSIYTAMRSLFMKNREIDPVILINTLVEDGIYDKSGGTQYVRLIAQVVPTSANVREYAKIMRDKATLRRLIGVCSEISEEAYTEQGEVDGIVDRAEKRMFDIAQKRDTKNFVHIRDLVSEVYKRLELIINDKDSTSGTPTGFSGLDSVLVGMGKGDLVLIGARPGMGKTSFALNIAANVAKSTKKTVAIFSLEMSGEQLASRLLSSEALVDSYALRSGKLNDSDWEKLSHAAEELAECELLVDDTTGLTITQMKAKLRRTRNLGLVIIDYLQLMQSDKKTDNRVQEVSDISRNLKIMGKELGVPVICCAQLSRSPESRTGSSGKRPMLSDLRESGAIEQDADVVIFLYNDEYYNLDKKGDDENVIAEVIVAKNRHGATRTVKMSWVPKYTKFVTIDNKAGEGL